MISDFDSEFSTGEIRVQGMGGRAKRMIEVRSEIVTIDQRLTKITI
jgi:hypothetical protein